MSALNVMIDKPGQAVYTLVVGLGKTGLSVVRYLHALGERVIVVDSRDIPPGLRTLRDEYDDVECHTGKFDSRLFVQAHRIVVSPGVAVSEPALQEAKERDIEITGDIDLFANEVQAPVVGITGSNGKSTVTTLLAAMAAGAGEKAVASGNIGTSRFASWMRTATGSPTGSTRSGHRKAPDWRYWFGQGSTSFRSYSRC